MEDDDDFLEAIETDNKAGDKAEITTETPVGPNGETVIEVEKPPKDESPSEAAKTDEAPKAEEQEQPLELTKEMEAPKQAEPGYVPLAALLDVRDKAKALEARLAQIQQAQQPLQRPDEYEDPEGARAFDQAQVAQALYQKNLYWSEQVATIKYGDETVKAAKEWGFKKCDEDPFFNAKVAASPDPVGYVVSEYKREEIASKVTPDEFKQFQAWKEAQSQLSQAAPAAQPSQTSEIPPSSLASAPSAGDILTEPIQSEEDIFNEVVGKRK